MMNSTKILKTSHMFLASLCLLLSSSSKVFADAIVGTDAAGPTVLKYVLSNDR
jgi:hypothetical protein